MATNNTSNQSFTNNADGFTSGGGTTQRTLTVTGGNATITGSGAAVITLPSTTDTLVGRATTDTLTNKTISTGSVIDANTTVTEVLKKVYPVGSIYIATVITNPATLFGFGTWAAYAAGKTLIGVGTSDQAFAAAATGGESNHTLTAAELPAHSHPIDGVTVKYTATGGTQVWPFSAGTSATTPAGTLNNTGGGGAHNNLQPYVVTYIWTRTA